jgi:alkylresorcinol/alkylpyrone synthase
MVNATITGLGWTVPGEFAQDRLWNEFFAEHYAGARLAQRVWERSGVVTRHGVVDPRVEDVSGWSTGARMRRFVEEALPLGKDAVGACLADAGLAPRDVDQLTVVSCTGYATPGLDILLARDLGMDDGVQRLHVGHMGCYAAIPALATAADAAVARGRTSVLLCLELTSLHIQPPTDDREQMVAHALFADAAAAVVVAPAEAAPAGLDVVDVVAHTDAAHAGLMTWDVTDLGFRMGLSPKVPKVLAHQLPAVIGGLLARHGLTIRDVQAWAVHPGGPRIVEVVAERLALDEDAVVESREVLRDHGNCSSATVLLILDRIARGRQLPPGAPVVALAFGPGLTLYAALLSSR